jgi:hypothetical protein
MVHRTYSRGLCPSRALLAHVINTPIPKTIVTVNREADMYAEMLSLGTFPHGAFTGRVSLWRLARLERRIYHAFDKVIAIGAPDVPPHIPALRTAIITSFLDENPKRWSRPTSKDLFFVGNVAHYPNRLAINHIVSELAPVLARVPDAEFVIVGASQEQIREGHRRPEIRLMGMSNPAEVQQLFLNSALFICPIENTHGMKFKVAEETSAPTNLRWLRHPLRCPQIGDLVRECSGGAEAVPSKAESLVRSSCEEFQASETGRQSLRKRTDCRSLRVLQPWDTSGLMCRAHHGSGVSSLQR